VSEGVPPRPGSLGKGVVIVIGLTVAAFVVAGAMTVSMAVVGIVMIFGIGVVQAAWIIPIWLSYRKRGETETAKGMLIMAGIVFLLNAGCWGLIGTMSLSSMH